MGERVGRPGDPGADEPDGLRRTCRPWPARSSCATRSPMWPRTRCRATTCPTWLTEGMADYVGYRGSGVPDSLVGAQLFAQVRESGAPEDLPAESEFDLDRSGDERRVGYQAGWAFCQMVVDEYGEDALVPFYVAVSRGEGSTAERLDDAADKVLGTTFDDLRAQWQAWLRPTHDATGCGGLGVRRRDGRAGRGAGRRARPLGERSRGDRVDHPGRDDRLHRRRDRRSATGWPGCWWCQGSPRPGSAWRSPWRWG